MSFKSVALKDSPGWFYDHLETSGADMFDVSGNDLDGTYSSVTLDQDAMLHQMLGGSVLFDGASGHLAVSNNVGKSELSIDINRVTEA